MELSGKFYRTLRDLVVYIDEQWIHIMPAQMTDFFKENAAISKMTRRRKIHLFFRVTCSAWKKTFFYRKKVVRMVSMNTKKVFWGYKVFQNWYFYIFSLLLIKNLKSKNYLPKGSRNDLTFQIASSSNHMSIIKLRNVTLNNSE